MEISRSVNFVLILAFCFFTTLNAAEKGAFHHKMYGQNNNGSDHHRKSWQVLTDVNGLKNEEVAMFVTSTNNFEGAFLRER